MKHGPDVVRPKLAPGTPTVPAPQTLDVVVAKIGADFPALGTTIRAAWISSA